MHFNEQGYIRPEMDVYQKAFEKLLKDFSSADTIDQAGQLFSEINDMRKEFYTVQALSQVRFTQDTRDQSNQEEMTWVEQNTPVFEGLENQLEKAMIDHPLRSELEKKYGSHLFNLFETHVNIHKPEIEEDLKEENKICNEYTKFLASMAIPFRGEEYNLAGIKQFLNDTDPQTRKEAYEARDQVHMQHAEKLDDYYDRLVKLRNRMAQKLGYENFIRMGYDRMRRTDYGPEDVAVFREQIEQDIVPMVTRLTKQQAKRLGVEKLKNRDEGLEFTSGNPKPKGDKDWILDNGRRMYSELAPETEEFFDFMMENELMDLENRKGKAGGGYCTFIFKYNTPFIFANFTGSHGDVKVLTHEVGHAFQMYCSHQHKIPELIFPTMEACEIHSMSMEFLTLPWMPLFFKEDSDKFNYQMINDRLKFLPYSAAVDEFQHYVYENPNASPEMRKKKWKELENRYLPHRDYEGSQFFQSGGYWQMQRHIYLNPFYYIDYALADICAMQFWKKSNEDKGKALEDYIRLCKAGGTKPFSELAKLAGLKSPFEKDAVHSITDHVNNWLRETDDSKF